MNPSNRAASTAIVHAYLTGTSSLDAGVELSQFRTARSAHPIPNALARVVSPARL